MPPKLPEGLLIGPANRQWRVGKMLGSGACGAVHEIAPASAKAKGGGGGGGRAARGEMEYVVKIAPAPPPDEAAKKRKKKKKTALELNADLLHFENVQYRNVLNDLRGVQIPEVPHSGDGGPPGYGEEGGYAFLCMEKMEAPLAAIVPMLLDEQRRRKARTKVVPFGEIACALVGLVEAIHSHGLIFVDVKSENFMLARPTSLRAQTCSDVCRRLRMIDFGLVENFRSGFSGGSHREDAFPDGQPVGTPLYASINVLEGHTASRRDDIEALGYVILELLMMLTDDKGVAVNNSLSPLPWASGKSDEEILSAKKKAIEGKNFFKSFSHIGSETKALKSMNRYFEEVRKIEYAKKPDYEGLKNILRDISVRVGDDENEEKPAATEARSRRAGPRRSSRRTRSADPDDDTAEKEKVSPVKKIRGSNRQAAEAVEVIQIESGEDSDTEGYHSCCSTEDRDCEVSDENTPPSREVRAVKKSSACTEDVSAESDSRPEKRAGKGKGCIEVVFISGPHEGESFALGGESPTVVTVGSNPPRTRSKSSGIHKICNDHAVSASHVKLTLYSAKGGVYSVKVTDLKGSGGVEVNGKAVASGKYKQAFGGGKIRIGDSVMQLKK